MLSIFSLLFVRNKEKKNPEDIGNSKFMKTLEEPHLCSGQIYDLYIKCNVDYIIIYFHK